MHSGGSGRRRPSSRNKADWSSSVIGSHASDSRGLGLSVELLPIHGALVLREFRVVELAKCVRSTSNPVRLTNVHHVEK